MTSRRSFLTAVMTGACFPHTVFGQVSSNNQEPASDPEFFDKSAIDFWTKNVRLGKQRAGNSLPDPSRVPEFLIYTEEKPELRTIAEITNSELLPSGDANVTLSVSQFKPSTKDLEESRGMTAASLRIDVRQQKPLFPDLGVLSWTLMAGLFSKKQSSLPKMPDLNPDAGMRIQNVPLPGGSGRWTWNVFAQEERSVFSKFITFLIGEAEKFVPLLSLPAITAPSLKAFDSVFGYWQSRAASRWLFNSADVDVYATKTAKEDIDAETAVPLVKGTYVVIPRVFLPQFKPSQDKLVVQRGVIVPQKTDPKDVFAAANEVLPNVTYVTLDVKVKRQSSETTPSKPKS